jgi:molybdopterin molybdotransferase
MLTVEEAQQRVLDAVLPLEMIELPVGQALGSVVATDIVARHPLPRFDNSAMDGYALIAADIVGATPGTPIRLVIVGEVRAGHPVDLTVLPGHAARIMTGAPLPHGADTIVPIEDSDERGDAVLFTRSADPGRYVRPAGEDLGVGDVLVRRGTELGPGELALLAAMGSSPLPVHRRPKVAVLVTGDELVPPDVDPGPGQIRDSNTVALHALVGEAGGEVVACPPVSDSKAATRSAFEEAAQDADLVVSSGGVAVGRYDFVKEVIEELGRIDLWRVAMQPGKPVVLGSIGEVPFLGLPGNPVSIHVSFEQFVRPAIRKMRGLTSLFRPRLTALLIERITKPAGRLHLVRVRLQLDAERWLATPTGAQGSHIQSSLVECDGVALFPQEATVMEAGERIVVEMWRSPARTRGE